MTLESASTFLRWFSGFFHGTFSADTSNTKHHGDSAVKACTACRQDAMDVCYSAVFFNECQWSSFFQRLQQYVTRPFLGHIRIKYQHEIVCVITFNLEILGFPWLLCNMNMLRYNIICLLMRSFHISSQNFNTMFCLYCYAVLTSSNQCILTFYACAMIQQSPCDQINQL